MKTFIASIFALALIGASGAYAQGVGVHVGPIGVGVGFHHHHHCWWHHHHRVCRRW